MSNLYNKSLILLTLLFLIATGFSVVYPQSTNTINSYGEKIRVALESGNLDIKNQLDTLLEWSQKKNYKKGKAQYYGLKGLYYQDRNNYKLAITNLLKSLKLYEELGLLNKIASTSNNLGNLFFKTKHHEQALSYYKKALAYHRKSGNKKMYASTCCNIGANYHNEGNDTLALYFYNKGLEFSDSITDQISYSNLLLNKGGAYDQLGVNDSAEYYYHKALPLIERIGNPEGISKIYNNFGFFYERLGKLNKALEYYHKSLSTAQKANRNGDMFSPLEGLMMVHNQLGNNDSVEYYYIELATVNEKLFNERNDKNIQEAKAKYNADKVRRDLKQKHTEEQLRSSNILLILVFVILLIILFALAGWIILERKRRRIRRQLRLQEEEIDRMVRSQEVLAFQSQLEGEAQERRRIAQELHDRVGGLLATLHLHFEAFTEKNTGLKESAPLKDLVKTAIQEVRTVSHNLEGIGQGTDLELALEQLEKGLNSTGKLNLQLFYEANSAQLSGKLTGELYKIIQELVTNTLRHAKARNVTLQVSQPDSEIQVIFEDDGIGFDPETIRRGMGLNGILQRCRHLGGTCTIDSRAGKGSTIILQIPLQTT